MHIHVLMHNARLAQDERKRAQTVLDVAKRREREAIAALEKATQDLKRELPADETEHVVMEGDSWQNVSTAQ